MFARQHLLQAMLVLSTAFAVAAGPDCASEGSAVTCDLGSIATRHDVDLVIEAVSVQKLFRANLNEARFGDYLSRTGADYVIRIVDRGRSQRLITRFQGLELAAGGDPDRMDLRIQISFEAQGELLKRIYVDGFGGVLCQGKRFTVKGEASWLQAVFQEIATDFPPIR